MKSYINVMASPPSFSSSSFVVPFIDSNVIRILLFPNFYLMNVSLALMENLEKIKSEFLKIGLLLYLKTYLSPIFQS
jgi:membrane protein insertase Oxa1/YidC/SpoIIIJ